MTNVEHTHYLIGTVTGPHPFPEMVRDFHRIIGVEAREQVLELTGRLPDAVVACVGGGSNAMGIFHRFIEDEGVRLVGVEAGGEGLDGRHAARFATRRPRRPARRDELPHAGRGRPDRRVALGVRRARLPQRRPRALAPARQRPRRVRLRHRRPRPWRPSRCSAAPRASSRRSSRRTRWPVRWSSAASSGPRARSSSTSPGAATRTCTRRPSGSAWSTTWSRTRSVPSGESDDPGATGDGRTQL